LYHRVYIIYIHLVFCVLWYRICRY